MRSRIHFGHKLEEVLKDRKIVPPGDDCPFTSFSNPYLAKTTPASPQNYPVGKQAGSSGVEMSDLIGISLYLLAQYLMDRKIKSIPKRQALVDDFLAEHKFLVLIINEALVKIEKYFGDGQKLVLEISIDPEDGSPDLLLLIQTEKKAVEALPILDKFDEEWWLDNSERAKGLLTIKMEYI